MGLSLCSTTEFFDSFGPAKNKEQDLEKSVIKNRKECLSNMKEPFTLEIVVSESAASKSFNT